ncbi:hypothetical protein CF319_g5884 [Tilletia indica]|nr:hypothetical protein CF319_g5884 [Tilletia indica]
MGFRIYWKNLPFSAKSWGPALDSRSRAVKVHLPPGQSADAYCEAICDAARDPRANISITHLWVVGTAREDQPFKPRYSGIAVAIFCLNDDEDNKGLPISWEDLKRLPGWFLFGGRWYASHFAGRIPQCTSCRGSFEYLHTEQTCPTPYCKGCHKHHPRGDCDHARYKGHQGFIPPIGHQGTPAPTKPSPAEPAAPQAHLTAAHPRGTIPSSSPPPPPPQEHIPLPPNGSSERDTEPIAGPSSGPTGTYGHIVASLHAKSRAVTQHPDPPKDAEPPRTPNKGKGKAKATQSSAAATPTAIAALFTPKRAATGEPGPTPPHKMARNTEKHTKE